MDDVPRISVAMGLRVGFDLDGTLADMYAGLRQEAVKLFGEKVFRHEQPQSSQPQEDAIEKNPKTPEADHNAEDDPQVPVVANHSLTLTSRQEARLWDHVKNIENFWTTLPELEPGIIARIASISAARGWEVMFLTTRPATAGDLVQIQSQRWLNQHGFQYPSVYVVQQSRGKIADALQLDAFVDDRPENCLDIAVESSAKAILVWHGSLADVPPGAARLGVRSVTTISEAITLLEQLDNLKNRPSLMQSIKRALGGSGNLPDQL